MWSGASDEEEFDFELWTRIWEAEPRHFWFKECHIRGPSPFGADFKAAEVPVYFLYDEECHPPTKHHHHHHHQKSPERKGHKSRK